MKIFYHEFGLKTGQNNLYELQENLADQIQDLDYFHITDFTEDCYQWVEKSGIQDGLLTVQVLHTTCLISINELDEPCLLGDINNYLREELPKTRQYLHNGPLRHKNLCAEDTKCDRNGDAHMKSFLYGTPTQSVLIKNGKPIFGEWQRMCMIDLDGPRDRKVMVQVMGQ